MAPCRVHDNYNIGNIRIILHRRLSSVVTAGDGPDDLTVALCVYDRTVARSSPDRIAACVHPGTGWVGRNVWLMDDG